MAMRHRVSYRAFQLVVFLQLGALRLFVRAETCAAAQFYDTKSTACTNCPTGCSACTSSTSCSACRTGYFASGSLCQACPTGCSACTGLNSCTTCKDNYYKTLADGCEECSRGCKKCTASEGTACTQCQDGWFYEVNQCYVCIAGCQVCKSTTTCDRCFSSYTLNSTTSTCTLNPSSSRSSSSSSSSSLGAGGIVGVILGTFACFACVGFGIYCLIKRRRQGRYFNNRGHTKETIVMTTAAPTTSTQTVQIQMGAMAQPSGYQQGTYPGMQMGAPAAWPQQGPYMQPQAQYMQPQAGFMQPYPQAQFPQQAVYYPPQQQMGYGGVPPPSTKYPMVG